MKVGSFGQAQEPNRNAIHRKGLETSSLLRPEWMATAMTGKFVPWRGRVLTKAGLRNWDEPEQNPQYSSELSARDREVFGSLPGRDCLHNVAYLYLCPCFEYARESTTSQEAKAAAVLDKRQRQGECR